MGTFELIKQAVAAGERFLSDHALERLIENGISPIEIASGLESAELIEDYPDAYKGPSVLLLQHDSTGEPIHVVWGLKTGTTRPAIVVTAYRPDPMRWSTDFRRRL